MAEEVPYVCSGCQAGYRVKNPKPDAAYACKKCGGRLEVRIALADEPEKRVWEIPVRLGRYIIDGEVGRGGMGVIYRGRQEGLDRVVAIKMMLPGPASDPEMAQRFDREARAAAALRHPNIVAVHEIGEYRGQPFFTMDFVEGKGLDKVLEDGPMPPKRGAEILRDVARAAHYGHGEGIVHRDLKPANIMIDKEGVPRVTDFGLAKQMDSKTMLSVTGEVMGTPAYMSPEQAEGRIREIDAQSDVYSIGAILYRILTGHAPFEGPTMAATIYKVVHEYTTEPVKLNRLVPHDLSSICMRALEKEKHRRYMTADELADDLERYIKGEPVQARPISSWEKVRRRLKRNKTATAVVAGVSILAVLAVLAVLAFVGESELDILERNLKDPAMRKTAAGALFDGLGERWSGKDKSRARKLALELLPDKELREMALAAFEKGKLDDWEDGRKAMAAWLSEPGPHRPRVIKWFALRKDRSVAPQMVELVRQKDIDAIRYFRAVPDASAFYALGRLVTDPVVGEEARLALERQYVDKVVAFFNPAAAGASGSIAQLGRDVDAYNKRMEDLLNGGTGQPKPKDAVDFSIAMLRDLDETIRLKAAYELGQSGDARAREPLFAALSDEDEGVSKMAADSLAKAGAGEHKAKLVAMLGDAKPGPRRAAAMVLGRLGDASVKNALKTALAKEKDAGAEAAMIEALGRLK